MGGDGKKLTVVVPAGGGGTAVADAVVRIGEACRSASVPMDAVGRMELAIEEVLQNISSHAGAASHTTVLVGEGAVTVVIEDTGPPFDPWAEAPIPDLQAELDDRPIGGLGVYLAKTLMDRVGYSRVDGRNVVEMVKTYGSVEACLGNDGD